MVKLIMGLGNPGLQYVFTRHNIGHHVVTVARDKYETKYPDVTFLCSGKEMNLSGLHVLSEISSRKITPQDVLVIYDDIDLPLGTIRYRSKGSGGTHNGMKSVVDWLETENIPRLRFGIGKPPSKEELISHVLGKWDNHELKIVADAVVYAADSIGYYLEHGMEATMSNYNNTKPS